MLDIVWLFTLNLNSNWRDIDDTVRIFDFKSYILRYWFHIISLIFQFCSVYQTVVIAVFRFAAIYWPFKASKYLTNASAAVATVTCLLIAVAVHIPMLLHGVSHSHTDIYHFQSDIHTNNTGKYWYLPSYMKNAEEMKVFFHGYHMIVYHLLLFLVIPFCILLVLNVLLLHELRRGGSQHDEENKAVTKVVVALILVFLFSYSVKPVYMMDVHWFNGQIMNHFARSSCREYFTVSALVQILPLMNSTVNFVLYIGLRQSFRQQFISMFRCN